jgi:hypothetical protein
LLVILPCALHDASTKLNQLLACADFLRVLGDILDVLVAVAQVRERVSESAVGQVAHMQVKDGENLRLSLLCVAGIAENFVLVLTFAPSIGDRHRQPTDFAW